VAPSVLAVSTISKTRVWYMFRSFLENALKMGIYSLFGLIFSCLGPISNLGPKIEGERSRSF